MAETLERRFVADITSVLLNRERHSSDTADQFRDKTDNIPSLPVKKQGT